MNYLWHFGVFLRLREVSYAIVRIQTPAYNFTLFFCYLTKKKGTYFSFNNESFIVTSFNLGGTKRILK